MPARPASTEPSCLYPDEKEVAKIVLGSKRASAWPGLAVLLERQGMPKVDPQTGGRYWPKVKEFLDRREAVGREPATPIRRNVVEHF